MMEKVNRLFGVKKAIISGGAYADWTLLSRGLIDEIKFMLLPVVDEIPTPIRCSGVCREWNPIRWHWNLSALNA